MSYMCPNINCKYKKQSRNEGYCPECGTKLKKLGIMEARVLTNDKRDLTRAMNKMLFNDKTTDSAIKNSIQSDMLNLATHEIGSHWMRAGTLASFNATGQMISGGFKAIIDQNKILIKQNEQILRALKKLNEGE